ncbi:DUF4238 domain-containing protein [Brucella intermedia]|uniref:DUF4238 domain-containing protein n=1 Tax=Brucella intermedia TaxID=94625 RepID=UPI001E4C29A5|nr:DUF4238 domain-containing protein [Brucella intermedia]MCB4920654.1 DUF4238 domain-containing protein [Brucella intermedia]
MVEEKVHFKQNPPAKHHYIPAFYTKRWACDDGRILVFSKPHNNVIDRRLFPDATGYQKNLYRILASDAGEQIEDSFFKPVDNFADQALTKLESDPDFSQWTRKMRSNWTRFIMSLLLRCPHDLEILRQKWIGRYTQKGSYLAEYYANTRPEGFPAKLSDYLAAIPPVVIELSMFSLYQSVIDNEKIGSLINSMQWCTIDTSQADLQLLTSDCPVFRTDGLRGPASYLVMPIGPTRLFVAANRLDVLYRAMETPARTLVMKTNRNIVRGARKYVYAQKLTCQEFSFVRNQFGKAPQLRLIEEIFSNPLT